MKGIDSRFIDQGMATDEEVAQAVSKAVGDSSTSDRDRANHTGTQKSSTISDFAQSVIDTVIKGLSFSASSAIAATDTILTSLGKLQAQINLLVFGSGFQHVESLGETSTTSLSTYLTKVTITTPSLPLGDYFVMANYKVKAGANRSATIRIVDGTTEIRSDEPMIATVSDYSAKCMTAKLTNVSGVRTLTLQFKAGSSLNSSSTTVTLEQCSLTFWRIK